MVKYTSTLKVRYAETDRMGVVYYANYLIWFEVARTEYLKSRGISYRDLEDKKHLHLMVVESQCVHKAPATYDDEIKIDAWISQVKNASLTFEYRVYCEGNLLAEGKTIHVFTNKEGRPTKIPQDLRTLLK